jgi:hypothetical protein
MGVTYQSYSGTDIVATITIPLVQEVPLVIGSLQTLSYSVHTEVSPVRSLGRRYPKGFTSGPATIAGSLIFTVFDKHIVYDLGKRMLQTFADINNKRSKGLTLDDHETMLWNYMQRFKHLYGDYQNNIFAGSSDYAYIMMNDMPPFNITLTMQNEYGQASSLVLEGIVIVDEGQVMSIEDMLTEQTMSFMAANIRPLRSIGKYSFSSDPEKYRFKEGAIIDALPE